MSLRIGGGRRLKSLAEEATRPTMARVREALFNIWQGEIQGCRWLDLCTGYGTIGAEALVKGASWVVGVEQSTLACGVIRENWTKVGQGRFNLYQGQLPGVLSLVARQEAPFDFIYLDPPYQSPLYLPVLQQVQGLGLLKPDGSLVCEHKYRYPPAAPEGWECYDQRRYGNTGLSFYRLGTLAT